MPESLFDAKERERLDNMGESFCEVQRKYHLPPGDFPSFNAFVRQCGERKFATFPSRKTRELQDARLDDLLSKDIPALIPALMAALPMHTNPGFPRLKVSASAIVLGGNPFASAAVTPIATIAAIARL
ncbi:hypothetical protein BBJ28_00020441 [Nothophytophthora sp. Chile5]|nr:hypothetical protein BBJ28_00020441 [Nothophytophthora sp. Chile5]